jgi:MSHA biogenesis protein MshK
MKRLALALVASALAGAAPAAPFADPTQPPAIRGDQAVASGGPRIESILIAPDRRLAVINGQQVTIGSRIGSNVVVRISETEVVLRGAEGEQTLKLFPELARDAVTVKKGRGK